MISVLGDGHGGREMASIMMSCPVTGRGFAVGLEIDEANFQALPFVESAAHCPHCGKQHAWSKSNTWLASPQLPRAETSRSQ
jgi:hypothetical protein